MPTQTPRPTVTESQCPSAEPSDTGPCGPTFVLPSWGDAGGGKDPSHYTTIQLADIDGDGATELLGRAPAGLAAHAFDVATGQWMPLTDAGSGLAIVLRDFADPPPQGAGNTPPTDWTLPQYYMTIRTARLDDTQRRALVARGAAGIVVYRFAPGSGWMQLTQSGPMADGDCFSNGNCWNGDPSYYTTVWERFLPYGYPEFPTAGQQRALGELTALAKNLPQTCSPLPESDPSVRSRYNGTDEGVTLSELQAYEGCLQGAEGCDCAGDAPPFARCTPPAGSGVSEGDWTAVCNRIIDEAIVAQNVLAVFGHIEDIQTSLFIAENASLPGIVSDLKLEEAGDNPSASFTFADAFVEMLEAAGSFAGVIDGPVGGGLDIAGELMSSLISAVPSLSDTVDTTYEQLQIEFASRVQDTQKAFAANQYWILQDQGLLAAVGELGSSKGAWQKIDDVGMESMGRYGFALWIYQTLLPTFWQRYDITSCVSPSDPEYPGCNLSKCTAPPPAPYLSSYAPGGASFAGLMPPDSQVCLPCDSVACPNCTNECFYSQFPPDDTVTMVWGALGASCAYEPGNPNTAWTWPDCTLGISAASGSSIFTNRNGWNFTVVTGNPIIE